METVAERDRVAKGQQERSRERETVGGEREPGGRPWYRTRVGRVETAGEGRQQGKRSREPAAGEERGPLSTVLPGEGQDYSGTLAGMQLGSWSLTQGFCAAGLSSKVVPQTWFVRTIKQNHSLIQNSLKVVLFENLQGMNKPRLSKHFSSSGSGVGNEGTRFARALGCH